MAENLVARGIAVTVVEMLKQVLPPLDPEMAEPVRQRLTERGVSLHLGDAVAGFEPGIGGALLVRTQSNVTFPADLVILSIGVRPETKQLNRKHNKSTTCMPSPSLSISNRPVTFPILRRP